MFYFHDPLMNVPPQPITPPAITRVVEAPATLPAPPPPPAPPKGWQAASPAVAGGDGGQGKKEPPSSPSTQTPPPAAPPSVSATPCSVAPSPAARPAWQPPKGYTEWTRHTRTETRLSAAPAALAGCQPLPAWSVVSWKNLAPRSITGTREEAIAQVESDLAAAGVHHLDIQVYDAAHTIVALKAKT